MKKALFVLLAAVLVSLPAHAKVVSRSVDYKHGDTTLQGTPLLRERANADWQMVYFGGTVHSFTNPGADKVGIKGIAYNPKADERSWSYMVVFFKELFT